MALGEIQTVVADRVMPRSCREVGELRVPLQERELLGADRAVAVLREDHLGEAPILRVLVVVLVAVEEHHEVGVLLDRAATREGRRGAAACRAALDGARELRQRDDRHLEVAGEHLERARDLRHLLHAVLGVRARASSAAGSRSITIAELRLARLQAARLAADLEHRRRGACRRRRSAPSSARRTPSRAAASRRPRAGRCAAAASSTRPSEHISRCATSSFDISSVNTATGMLVVEGEVRRHAERERRLAHGRAAGDDDEVARLEAGGQLVDVAEAGGRAGHLAARLVHLRDLLEAPSHEHLDVLELPRMRCCARSNTICSARSTSSGVSPGRSQPSRWISFADDGQPAQRRHLAHDPRVVGGVRGGRDERRDLADALLAADVLELAALVELVGDGDRVDRLPRWKRSSAAR